MATVSKTLRLDEEVAHAIEGLGGGVFAKGVRILYERHGSVATVRGAPAPMKPLQSLQVPAKPAPRIPIAPAPVKRGIPMAPRKHKMLGF